MALLVRFGILRGFVVNFTVGRRILEKKEALGEKETKEKKDLSKTLLRRPRLGDQRTVYVP